MAKEKETDVMESVAILVGVMVGGIFSYFYSYSIGIFASLNLWNLTIFLTIPTFSGFVSGLISRKNAMKNGLFVGVLSVAILLLLAVFNLLVVHPRTTTVQGDQFLLFSVMMMFLWMMLSATGALLAKEYYK